MGIYGSAKKSQLQTLLFLRHLAIIIADVLKMLSIIIIIWTNPSIIIFPGIMYNYLLLYLTVQIDSGELLICTHMTRRQELDRKVSVQHQH